VQFISIEPGFRCRTKASGKLVKEGYTITKSIEVQLVPVDRLPELKKGGRRKWREMFLLSLGADNNRIKCESTAI